MFLKSLLIVAPCVALAGCSRQQEGPANGQAKDIAGQPAPAAVDVCVVSGEKLGSMGTPVGGTHDGKEVQLCCKGCVEDFNKDPQKYLAKLDAAKNKP